MTRTEATTLQAGAIVRHTTGRLYQVQYFGADGKLVVRGQKTGDAFDAPEYGVKPSDCTRVDADVTDKQIAALLCEAAEAGDLVMAYRCGCALGWPATPPSHHVPRMTRTQARVECARVIAAAAAQQDGGTR